MPGDREDAIGMADEDAVNIMVEEERSPKRTKAPHKKKGWSTMRKVTVVVFMIFILIVIPIGATFQIPAVDVIGAEIRSSGSGIQKTYTLYATVQVGNPNLVGVTVTSITGQFYVNDAYGGDFQKTDSVTIVAQGSTVFDVQVILKSAVPIHVSNTVRVKGTVSIQGAMTSWDVPFDDTRSVNA